MIVLFTLKMALVSTLAIAPLALLLAALSWRAHPRIRVVLDSLGALPLVLPPTAVGFILLQLLWREVLFTPVAVVIACAVMSFPLMFTAFRVALDTSDRRLFDIARTLGASRTGAFVRVTLPLAWRGLLSGAILAWCRAIG